MSFDSVTDSKTIVRCKCCKSMENKHSNISIYTYIYIQASTIYSMDLRFQSYMMHKEERKGQRQGGGEEVNVWRSFFCS